MAEAFRESLALIFPPFTGFRRGDAAAAGATEWHVTRRFAIVFRW
jgi:hypothetical protein